MGQEKPRSGWKNPGLGALPLNKKRQQNNQVEHTMFDTLKVEKVMSSLKRSPKFQKLKKLRLKEDYRNINIAV